MVYLCKVLKKLAPKEQPCKLKTQIYHIKARY